MWTFQSLRESASGLFRRQEEHQGSHGPAHKDAMNNLVTPQSIVKFTVPQMRSHALPETSLTPPEESKRDCWLEDDREKPCHGNKSDRGIVIPGRSESPSFRTPNGSPSSWSFRSKWLRMKPDSRPASPVPHAIPQVVGKSLYLRLRTIPHHCTELDLIIDAIFSYEFARLRENAF